MIHRTVLTPIRRLIVLATFFVLLLPLATPAQASPVVFPTPIADSRPVLTIELNGVVDPNTARYVARAIDEATDADAALLVIQLNSPGGLNESVRQVVNSILRAPVTVAAFVRPRGAQAGTGAMFVLAAAHIAVMSPSTSVGAVSPVDATGKNVREALASKVPEDTRAFARSIADARDRDPAPLEAAITEARSYSAREARLLGIVDVLATDIPHLLRMIRGLDVRSTGGYGRLYLTEHSIRPVERTVEARADGRVLTVNLDGFIDPNAARYVDRAINEADDAGAALLVIQLNTPGGLAESAREMVSVILESPVPVAVFVTPRGAQAASAGMFVLAAAGVAAMSPGTNVGAASPIDATGQDVPETLASKVLEDTRAFARSIADARGRDPAPLEAAITEARSYSASEALDLGIADILADDLPDLLRQINGTSVPTAVGEVQLNVADAPIQPVDRTLLEHFLSVVASPDLAFILLTVGGIALLIELANPGLVVPGVTGAIALGLGFVGLGQLPVNWLGVALVLIALGLLFLEFQEPGAGVYGAGAGVTFIVGAILLAGGALRPVELDFPGAETLTVSVWVLTAMGAILAALTATLIVMAKTGKPIPYRSQFDRASMVGNRARVTRRLDPDGEVQMLGEFWPARLAAADDPNAVVEEGYAVEVTAVDGTTLMVKPASDDSVPDRLGAAQPPPGA